MLVLSRRVNESIQIDQEIEVTVLEVRGNRVKLAIKAPRHVAIRRSELPPHVQPEREASVSIPPNAGETALSTIVSDAIL